MEHSTEILYNKTEVYCSAVHRFGSDALLLARFCEPRRSQKAADLCSGCGIVSLEWHDRGHRGLCAAVELQPDASALLQEAVAAQGIEHITPYLTDLRTFREGEGQFDVCACNPPYFTAGPQSTDAGRATARHETDCTLEDVCACGFRLLKDGGKLSLCHRPERLAEVLGDERAQASEYMDSIQAELGALSDARVNERLAQDLSKSPRFRGVRADLGVVARDQSEVVSAILSGLQRLEQDGRASE